MKAAHWEVRASLHAWKRWFSLPIYAAVLSDAHYFLRDTSGILSFLVAAVIVPAGILLVKEVATLLAGGLGLTLRFLPLTRVALAAASIVEEDTYPRVPEKLLSDTFRVEVLNLRASAAQNEDIYKILRRHVPVLQPELQPYRLRAGER